MEFSGKVVIVTGGSQGIGEAAVRLFADGGARVVVADVLRDQGEALVAEIRGSGGEVMFVQTDVTDASAVESLVETTVRTYGGLHWAFNNAGISKLEDANWTPEVFDLTMRVNVYGVMNCMRAQLRHMVEEKYGAIVNTASIAAFISSTAMALPGYTASKHAVVGLTKAAALRHARDGIRVNALCPGNTETLLLKGLTGGVPEVDAMMNAAVPMGRPAHPREIAEAAVWLCSDRASFVTAHSMVVDGGFLAQ